MKIYLDSGASVKGIKDLEKRYEIVTFPYDSISNMRGNLSVPSATCFNDIGLVSFSDIGDYTFEDLSESDLYHQISVVVGKHSHNDILHLDSAYKSRAQIFLTSDKKDIWRNREKLEEICKFKIFHTPSEDFLIRAFIEDYVSNISSGCVIL